MGGGTPKHQNRSFGLWSRIWRTIYAQHFLQAQTKSVFVLYTYQLIDYSSFMKSNMNIWFCNKINILIFQNILHLLLLFKTIFFFSRHGGWPPTTPVSDYVHFLRPPFGDFRNLELLVIVLYTYAYK